MEDVAVGGGDVDVAGDDEVAVVVIHRRARSARACEEAELEVVVPVVDGPAVGDVDRRDPQRRRAVDLAAHHRGSRSSVLVAEVAGGDTRGAEWRA